VTDGDWLALAQRVEPLDDVDLDAALVAALAERTRARPAAGINFYVPSFKAYSTAEIEGCGKSRWPAVSITGAECALQCDHCRARILEPMLPARMPEDLWRVANEQIEAGADGMLLTGGSNRRDEVEYDLYYPVIRRIKDTHPTFRIAMHTALVTRDNARRIEAAGVDVAMLDVIGAQDTVSRVYHLRRPVADFEHSLAHLTETSLRVVPHIVIGLHYGRLLGEWNALEMIRRHRPAALVLVVVMPFYAPETRPFETPHPRAVGRFLLDARAALPDIPVMLGCARPPGRTKTEIDAYAVMAGLDGVAHPAEGVVELAARLGREVTVTPACCSMSVGSEVLGDAADVHGARIDPQQLIAAETSRRPGKALRGIRVVSA